MDKIRLGRTNLIVSRIAFGGIPIQRVSEGEAVAVVNECLSLGINFIDTANAYTTSEKRIGKAVSGRRNKVIIGTKSLAREREEMENHLRLSLEHLGTDYLDLYQFHNISDGDMLDKVLADHGPLALATEYKRRGVIRHLGVTSHSLEMAKELVRTDLFETLMFPFNMITNEATEELLPLVKKYDVGFIAMKPLEGGRIGNPRLAFKYLLQFPDIVIVVGIERPEEIVELVAVADQPGEFGSAEEAEMNKLQEELGGRFCRRCDYCQPCPQEIPISFVMDYPSLRRRLPGQRVYVEFVADAMDKAAQCTECGDCEERCPYNLPIRDMLKGYVADHEVGKAKYLAGLIGR